MMRPLIGQLRPLRLPLQRLALLAPLTLILALLVPSPAWGRPLSNEEREGQRVVSAAREGERDCAEVSREEFIAAGEYAMGQRFDSARAHEAMDRLMSEMMGARAEEQMHEYLGRQTTSCRGGRSPAGFAGMMAMMSSMGGFGPGPGGMMGGPGSGRIDHHGDWDGGGIVAVVFVGLLLFLAGGALLRLRPRQQPDDGGPLAILARRYARGEIDSDDYERRRQALGGTS